MTVYDDCYKPANALGTRNIGGKEKKRKQKKRGRSALTVEREETTVENSEYLSVTCLLDTFGRETMGLSFQLNFLRSPCWRKKKMNGKKFS